MSSATDNQSLSPITGKTVQQLAPVSFTATTTGSSVTLPTGATQFLVVQAIGVVAGTLPTLDGVVQGSYDGGSTWQTLGTFAQVTASTNIQTLRLVTDARTVRYVGTVGGTLPVILGSVLLIT